MSAEFSARSVSEAEQVDKVRALQRVLYRSAKQDSVRRFHALFDKVARSDILWRAWVEVASNRGAPGVDGVTITSITDGGVDGVRAFLDDLAQQLRDNRLLVSQNSRTLWCTRCCPNSLAMTFHLSRNEPGCASWTCGSDSVAAERGWAVSRTESGSSVPMSSSSSPGARTSHGVPQGHRVSTATRDHGGELRRREMEPAQPPTRPDLT